MRYRKRIFIGTVNGVKKYKSVYADSKREAERLAMAVKLDLGRIPPDSLWDGSVDDWLRMYLSHKEKTVRVATLRTMQCHARVLRQAIGTLSVNKVKPFVLQDTVNNFAFPSSRSPLSKTAVKNFLVFTRAFFEFVVENDGLSKSPATKLKLPNGLTDGKRTALTLHERAVVDTFEHPMQTCALICMYAGLRRGELLALRWEDIDLDEKTILVNKAADTHNPSVTHPPKNGKARTVTIPQKLADHLKACEKTGDGPFARAAEQCEQKSFQTLWDNYISTLIQAHPEVSRFTPHRLRHTFCTIMYEAGIDVLVAQRQMGHASPNITMAVYTSLMKEHEKANLSKLDEYLKSV